MPINLNAIEAGEDVAALVGGTTAQSGGTCRFGAISSRAGRSAIGHVDVAEFRTISGADYEHVFGELAKYDANNPARHPSAVTSRPADGRATQPRPARRGLSNLDGLFAFHTRAEDAGYLTPELGGGLDAQHLLQLGN